MAFLKEKAVMQCFAAALCCCALLRGLRAVQSNSKKGLNRTSSIYAPCRPKMPCRALEYWLRLLMGNGSTKPITQILLTFDMRG